MSVLRLAKVAALPAEYAAGFYKRDAELAEKPYATQLQVLFDDCFAFADFWKTGLEKTGKFSVLEILHTVKPLQKRWALENGVPFSPARWKEEILDAQLDAFAPDIIFIPASFNATAQFALKRKHPSIRFLINWDGTTINDPARFPGTDLILSDDILSTRFYQERGLHAYNFRFGFSPKILRGIAQGRERYDTTFTGSLQMGNDYHLKRFEFLAALARQMPLDLWVSYFPHPSLRPEKNWLVQLRKMRRENYRDAWRLFLHNHGGVFGLAMFQVLADSKITLNMHGPSQNTKAGNMRLWEATGVGALLLTDDKDNMRDHFEPGKEIVTYTSVGDAIDKIKYFLTHENERRAIAEAGQRRTLRDYTYDQRFATFGTFLEQAFAKQT